MGSVVRIITSDSKDQVEGSTSCVVARHSSDEVCSQRRSSLTDEIPDLLFHLHTAEVFTGSALLQYSCQ